jgi:hypothetical protein
MLLRRACLRLALPTGWSADEIVNLSRLQQGGD